jgi:hypothetical protein
MVLLGVLSALLIAGLLVGGMWVWWPAIRRHPAGRERWPEPDGLRARGQPGGRAPQPPTGPDDDPEFISALERLIRGEDPGGLV